MHRWLTFSIVLGLASGAAVLWPSAAHAASSFALDRANEASEASGAADLFAAPAHAAEVVRARVDLEVESPGRCDVVIVGPAESTRALADRLRSAPTTRATFVCRSADRALREVADGHADAAVVAVPFEQISSDGRLRELSLGDFVVALVRHQDNQVTDVSSTQLVNLSHGRVRGWIDLGGARRELRAYSTFSGPTDEARALQLAQGVVAVRERGLTAEQVIERVSRDPGALGIVALRSVADSLPCVSIDGVRPSACAFASGAYPMGYRLRLVHRSDPRAPLAALLTFLRGAAGQQMLRDLAP